MEREHIGDRAVIPQMLGRVDLDGRTERITPLADVLKQARSSHRLRTPLPAASVSTFLASLSYQAWTFSSGY
jgi:hypothetical protein